MRKSRMFQMGSIAPHMPVWVVWLIALPLANLHFTSSAEAAEVQNDWREFVQPEHENRKSRLSNLSDAQEGAQINLFEYTVSRDQLPSEIGIDIPVLRIVFPQQSFFDSGSSEIRDEATNLLREVSRSLVAERRSFVVFIAGHTDSVGSAELNNDLSMTRAGAVAQSVRSELESASIWQVGFGESLPLMPNTSRENRSINRRVEFIVATAEEAVAVWLANQHDIICSESQGEAVSSCMRGVEATARFEAVQLPKTVTGDDSDSDTVSPQKITIDADSRTVSEVGLEQDSGSSVDSVNQINQQLPQDATPDSSAPTEGADIEQAATSQWEITVFVEHKDQRAILGQGWASLDVDGKPDQLAISYALPETEFKLLVSEGRTYMGTGEQGVPWLDFTEPIGLPSSIPMPTIQPVSGDYQESGSHTFESERYRLFEKEGVTIQIDDATHIRSIDSYWIDESDVIRRYISNVQLQNQGDVFSLVSITDRVEEKAHPSWYSYQLGRARRNAIPAAAAIRAMMHSGQIPREAITQLPSFEQRITDHQPLNSSTFSEFALLTGVMDFLLPKAHASHGLGSTGRFHGHSAAESPSDFPPGINGKWESTLPPFSDQETREIRNIIIAFVGLGYAIAQIEVSLGILFSTVTIYTVATPVTALILPAILLSIFTYALVSGEPHITTFDGYRYSLQAVGEFTQVETPTFMVQHRFGGVKGRNTSTKATAIRAGDHVIESYLSSDADSLSVVVDGSVVEVDYEGLSFDDGAFIARRDTGGRKVMRTKLIVVDPSGSYVLIENFRDAQNVSISLTDDMASQVSGGLGGIPDDNTANDFTIRDGTVMDLDESNTIEGLYGRFATSWRVRPEQRLFTQGDAEDYLTAEYTDIPQSITRISDFSQAEIDSAGKTCTDAGVSAGPALEDCTYDVLATGDPEWAQMAASSAVVLASVQPAPATPIGEPRAESVPDSPPTAVAITAKGPRGSSTLENIQWTIINQSTEEMLIPEMGSGAISVELSPGRYDVLVISDGYEGETTIEVEVSGSNQFVVDLQAQSAADGFSSPETVPAGELMSFEWKGPAAEKDRIFVAHLDMAENKYKTSNVHRVSAGSPAVLVAPALPGAYEVRYYSGANGSVAFRKALEVTAAEVRITAPGELIAGTEFTFDWQGPSAEGDRLFIAKPEMSASKYYADSDVSHMVTLGSSANLIAPVNAGDYEIRYYSRANGRPLVRTPIRVTPHTVKIDAPRTVAPGAEFEFSWQGPDAKGDFLFIAKPEMKENGYYLGAGHATKDGPSGKFAAPTDLGAYEIRYFSRRNGAMLAKRVFMVR